MAIRHDGADSGFIDRSKELQGIFKKVAHGKYMIYNSRSAKRFLEAVIDRSDPVICVQEIIGSFDGLTALQSALEMDVTPTFMNASMVPLLQYLQALSLKSVRDGFYLQRVVECLVILPTFWNALVDGHKRSSINNDSTNLETRDWGHKIKHILQVIDSVTTIATSRRQLISKDFGPGGRHDNDFLDFRRASIMPTARHDSQVLSPETPKSPHKPSSPPFRHSQLLRKQDLLIAPERLLFQGNLLEFLVRGVVGFVQGSYVTVHVCFEASKLLGSESRSLCFEQFRKRALHGNMIGRIKVSYLRELHKKEPIHYSLGLGILSSGEVIVKNPADFVGAHLGQSEAATKAILAASKEVDPYKATIVDTIVAETQSAPGEGRCVLLRNYDYQMEEMFQNTNPGLARRFAMDDAFDFKDFDNDQLRKILDLKVLDLARRRANFGNGSAVENLISTAKNAQQALLKLYPSRKPLILTTIAAIGQKPTSNNLSQDVEDCDDVIKQSEGYQKTAAITGKRGPPETGKTMTAAKMGKIFYDMGFLATAQVEECSATDLIGQYVDQTGSKMRAVLQKALSKVLFIDEVFVSDKATLLPKLSTSQSIPSPSQNPRISL
ncbi:hypothetical protein BDV97DRAFT_387680 [Delphinella strobiligena]|nr:hypothetical protein BDV97DRAFT_387680 [Delphinella strobiligena]